MSDRDLRDLELAFKMADAADETALRAWSRAGVPMTRKADGSPVTEADVAAEQAVLQVLRATCPDDGFLGEETGEHAGSSGRRWIIDGIDGTRFFAAGAPTWGTLIALERDGDIILGLSSSPAQHRRWWAERGRGAFTGPPAEHQLGRAIHVSASATVRPSRMAVLPAPGRLLEPHRHVVEQIAGGLPPDVPWSHQNAVAEGRIELCVWFGGDIWDHAAPSIIVEEAGGRFTDHDGGHRLDTRTAIYSNGVTHDQALTALART